MNPWTIAGTTLGWIAVVFIWLICIMFAAGLVTVIVIVINSGIQTIRDSAKDKFAPRRGILKLLPRKETDDADTDPAPEN